MEYQWHDIHADSSLESSLSSSDEVESAKSLLRLLTMTTTVDVNKPECHINAFCKFFDLGTPVGQLRE